MDRLRQKRERERERGTEERRGRRRKRRGERSDAIDTLEGERKVHSIFFIFFYPLKVLLEDIRYNDSTATT